MCCNKPNMNEKDIPWFEQVRAGPMVTNFSSEAAALQFLKKGIDNVEPRMQPVYAALRFRYENAND